MKTVRRPPYPKWNPGYFPCSSLIPLPLSSRRPSVSFGGFGLRKRESYRNAFDGFDVRKIAEYGDATVSQLLADPGIIRNRLKVNAAIENARAFMAVQQEFGSFDSYQWAFVGGNPKKNAWKALSELPAKTPESEAMSKELRARGFKFVGPTICYAHMQAVGMVNDHLVGCFRYDEVS